MKQSRDHPQNNRGLNQVILYLWSKFCDRVSSYHVDKPEAQNWVKFDFEVKLDLQGQGQFGPNLVILTWTGHKLSCRQLCDRLTHRWMDGHTKTQAMTIPKSHNWPHIKITWKEKSIHNQPLICMNYANNHTKWDFKIILCYLVKNLCVPVNMASFKIRNSSQYLFYDETAFWPSNSRWWTSTMTFTVHLSMWDTSNVEILKLMGPAADTH